MINSKTIDELLGALARVLPNTPKDVERNVRAALSAALERLDLVTREELEVQEVVLARTRARLKELEEKVAALERRTVKP
jgi:ubiquinone biosynthesis accessory factor UbiK